LAVAPEGGKDELMPVSPEKPSSTTQAADQIQHDARSLLRGFLVNVAGYLPKVAYPLLLVVVVRLYGKEQYGVFKVVEAVLFLALYLGLLGLDKATLWWIPRQPPHNERSALRPMLAFVGAAGIVAMLLTMLFAPWIADWQGSLDATGSLRLMAPALLPMVLMQILVNACLGKRQVEAQVIAREALVSVVLALSAIALFHSSLRRYGLSLAFLLSNMMGLIGAGFFFRRAFRGSQWPKDDWHIPRPVLRYALPMWLTGLVAALMGRVDVIGLAALTSQRAVGIYAAVVDVAKVLRAVQVSFNQIVVALASEISLSHDRGRLIAGFSYATVLVMAIQFPICAFLVSFSSWIMPIFGDGFSEGAPALILASLFITSEGVLGLNGLLVSGFGRAGTTLFNMCVAVSAQLLLLHLLVPRYGIEGAAMSAGLAFLLQNLMRLVQVRLFTGGWNYNRSVLRVVLLAIAAAAAGGLARALAVDADALVRAICGFVVFLLLFGIGWLRIHRSIAARPR
jgi:O-antigen/teichoic acid export membrane protein